MAATTPRVILLQQNGNPDMRLMFSRPAAAAVTPGDLLELTTAGKVTPVAGAGKVNMRIFALESPFEPLVNAKSIDQVYPVDEEVRHIYAQPGDYVYARLAAAQTIAAGDYLVPSATAGCLQKVTPIDATVITNAIVGQAEEAVTTTGAVGRVKVRVI